MTTVRSILWVAVAVALAVFIWLNVWLDSGQHAIDDSSNGPTSAVSPTFSLTDQLGNFVTEQAYRGEWLLVFFGFTNCPDICPTTLAELAQVMEGLGTNAESVTPLFISIDPSRDRPKTMAEYVTAFHSTIVGLTGTAAQISAAVGSFKAYFEKRPLASAPDGYTMGHTSAVYLISPTGVFVRTYSYGTPAEEIVTDLQQRL